MYTTSDITPTEYIQDIHIKKGHVQPQIIKELIVDQVDGSQNTGTYSKRQQMTNGQGSTKNLQRTLQDPKDLDSTQMKQRRTQGRPGEDPEEDLNDQEVGIDTEPLQHLQDTPWEESQGKEIDTDNLGYPDPDIYDSQPEVQTHQDPEEQNSVTEPGDSWEEPDFNLDITPLPDPGQQSQHQQDSGFMEAI